MKLLYGVLCAAFISAVSVPAFGMDQLRMRDEGTTSCCRALTPEQKRMVDTCEDKCAQGCMIACPVISCCLINHVDPSSIFAGCFCGTVAGGVAGQAYARIYNCLNGHTVEKVD
jgi:hypothetical protein